MSETLSKGDQAREEILTAAERLFLSQGYHGTSMRAIAREAGNRAVAGLYNHFPTKEAIFTALIEEHNPYQEVLTIMEAATADAQTAETFLRTGLTTILQTMSQHYNFIQLAQIDMREFNGKNMRHVVGEMFFPRIVVVVQRLTNMPDLRPMSPVVWMRLMASLIIGYVFTAQIAPEFVFGDVPHDEWASYFADVLLHGVLDNDNQPD